MKKKILSIVVPTKNRYFYLKHLIILIQSLNSEDVEMIIQDNSDNNEDFIKYLNENSYSFIKYFYHKGQIPMSDNSDRGILNSTGKYICFIGDDDGVTNFILDAVSWMEKEGVEALKPATPNYCWPDAPQGRSADIYYRPFTSSIKFVDPFSELKKSLHLGFRNRGDMPLAYHAIVRRDILDKIYQVCGTYFPGNSPDISNAVALSLIVKKYAIVDMPIAYSGSSAFKGGGVFAKGNPNPEISQIPWFRANPEERWNKMLPRIANGSIIWADSALEALKNMGRIDLHSEFNKYKCYANLMVTSPSLTNYVYEVCPNKFLIKYYYFSEILKKVCNRIIVIVRRKLKIEQSPKYIRNINNIIEASNTLEGLVDKNSLIL